MRVQTGAWPSQPDLHTSVSYNLMLKLQSNPCEGGSGSLASLARPQSENTPHNIR